MMTNRDRQKLARKEMKKPVTKFQEIELDPSGFIPKGMTRAYKNSRCVVMVYDNAPVSTGTAIKAMIQKHDNTPIQNHWSEMQKIKNQIFGEETTAIEYYPAESELINDYNIYWLWIYPEGVLPIPKL